MVALVRSSIKLLIKSLHKVTQTQPILHVVDPVPREIQVVMVRPRDDDCIILCDFLYVFDGQPGRQFRLRHRFGFARMRESEVDVFE